MDEETVIVYTTPSCKYCKLTKEFLHEMGVAFTECDVSKDKEGLSDLFDLSGARSVPVTKIGEDVVIGHDEIELTAALKKNGLFPVEDDEPPYIGEDDDIPPAIPEIEDRVNE